ASSTDPGYAGLDPADVSVTNLDNDTPAIVVSPTSGLVTTEFGDTAHFTIALATQPTASVKITVNSADTTEGTVSPNVVIFTAATWNQPAVFTVTGRDDAVADGNMPFTVIVHAATSTDPAYNGLDGPDVAVTNLDNETPQVIVLASPLETSEAG